MSKDKTSIPAPSIPGITILHRLGKNVNAWHAYDDRSDVPAEHREIAVKAPVPGHHPNEGDLMLEARVLADVHQYYAERVAKQPEATAPNIVRLHDVWEMKDTVYLGVGYLPNRNLLQSRLPLRDATILRYGVQMSNALALVHKAGYMHRDAKLENYINIGSLVMPHLVLLDFSAACKKTKDTSGTFVGTAGYMSPEQLEYEHDPRADVFATGVNLYFLLNGRLPFLDVERGQLDHPTWAYKSAKSIRRTTVDWSRLRFPHKFFPLAGRKIINAMLEPDGKKRPSLLEVGNAFSKLQHEAEITPLGK